MLIACASLSQESPRIVEPFTVQCSSCQSRIRVRNPSLIGQLVNCPKCGSLVLVAAPQQILVDSPGGTTTDSMSLTKDALPTPDSNWPLPDSADDLANAAAVPLPPPLPGEAFDLIPPGAWTPDPPAATPTSSSAEQPEPASSSRQVLLVAGLGLCSLLLAGGVFFLFLRSFGRGPTVAQNSPAAPPPVAAIAPSVEPAIDDANTTPAVLPASPPASSATDSATGPSTPTASPVDTNKPVDSPPPIPANSETASSMPATGAPLNGTALPSAIFPAAEPSAQPSTAAPANPPAADVSDPKRHLPPGLQSFASLFDQALVPVLADAAVPLSAAPETTDGPAATAETPEPVSPLNLNLPEVVDQKLAIKLTGLLIQDRPLAEVLCTLSQASDLPFVCDIDALRAGGINPRLAIQLKTTTPLPLSELLAQLASDYQLSFEPFEKKLIVVRSSPALLEQRIPSALPVGDLLSKPEDGALLITTLETVLPELAGAMQYQSDQLLLDYSKVDRLAGFQVMRLLATWRSLRQPANAPSTTSPAMLERLPAWPMESLAARASQKTSYPLLPEPVVQSWQRLTAAAALDCWVDWPSLSSAQIALNQTSVTLAYDRSLLDLLQASANKHQVVFAIEDEQSLWVTTPEMHRAQGRFFVIPAGDKTREQWQTELQSLTPYNVDGTAMLRVVAAPDGQFFFVRCCRPILVEPNP